MRRQSSHQRLRRPARPQVPRVEHVYDAHGEDLFRLAYVICGDVEQAGSAVVGAFQAAFSGPDPCPRDDQRLPQELARLTYAACRTARPDRGGAAAVGASGSRHQVLLALARYGHHTYEEASMLLDIQPCSGAEALRSVLRQGAETRPDG